MSHKNQIVCFICKTEWHISDIDKNNELEYSLKWDFSEEE